jgi:photosystem II stability/assembly factor-like uncharacterized protein
MANSMSPGVNRAGNQAGEALSENWPGWAVAALVIIAALYSFSPRPPHEFAPTGLHADRLLITSVASESQRLVAVGEQGNILYADSVQGPWRSAHIEPNRGSTLTRVLALGNGVMLAVGHDSWILRSQDRGQNWKEVQFNGEKSEPLLGIAGPYDGKLYAFGAFGQFMTSRDLGVSWQQETLVEEGGSAAPKAPTFDPTDIFAGASDLGGGLAESHLNDMTLAADGSLYLVGERGLIARSTNAGKSWRVLPEIYPGSFYGVLALPAGRVLVYGMRGNTFYTDNAGRSWQRSKVPGDNSLFGGTRLRDGRLLLMGANNTLLMSSDNGTSFVQVSEKGPHGVISALPIDQDEFLKVGEGGLTLVRVGQGKK